MPNRIREETNDLIILDNEPKKNRSAIKWGGIFILFGIIAEMFPSIVLGYIGFLSIVLGGIGFVSNLYSFYADESVTVNKKNSNIVIDSKFSRQEICFSEVNNIKVWDDTWPGEFTSNVQIHVITAREKILIFNSDSISSVEEVAGKINKLINHTTSPNL